MRFDPHPQGRAGPADPPSSGRAEAHQHGPTAKTPANRHYLIFVRLGIDASVKKPYCLGMDVKTATAALAAAKVRRFDGAPFCAPRGAGGPSTATCAAPVACRGAVHRSDLAEVVALARR